MKIFLYPFAGLYWIITYIRNKFFDWGILTSKSYSKSVIAVGNLNVGGTGKSPFVIYLVNQLKDKQLVGIVSRGYGRKSKGYYSANYYSTFEEIGDEPIQFFERFRNKVVIGVHEKRTVAISHLIKDFNPDLFVLDDAFQHRYVKANLNILLTDYQNPYYNDHLLPLGRLREGKYGAKRAQIIIVSKCPKELSDEDKKIIERKLRLQPNQALFFSEIIYDTKIISNNTVLELDEVENYKIVLITGIAKYKEILDFAESHFLEVTHLNYEDHHNFSKKDIEKIDNVFSSIGGDSLILTTEKDFMRLKHFQVLQNKVFYIPINIKLDQPDEFSKLINLNLGT